MSRDKHPLIAREGWLHAALATLVALVVTATLGWWSLPFWLLLAFVLQFFRDPPREIPSARDVVVSAADGRVVQVGKARDPYVERDALKISVFMNVFNVHSNRSPVAGNVMRRWYHAGGFLNAALDKASVENERMALWIEGDDGAAVTCVQVAGLVARRILCYADVGEHLARGQRYGFIRFGSRVDVYLPATSAPKVAVGDIVTGGVTIIAALTK